MRKSFAIAVGAGALLLGSLVAAPAGAQTDQTTTTRTIQSSTVNGQDISGPHNPYCGAWTGGTWTPNGNCTVETTTTVTTTNPNASSTTAMAGADAPPVATRMPERVTGTIVGINGHMVTLQHGNASLIVDDSRALNREDTGHVTMGRAVTAHGYWEDGTFYASSFQ